MNNMLLGPSRGADENLVCPGIMGKRDREKVVKFSNIKDEDVCD